MFVAFVVFVALVLFVVFVVEFVAFVVFAVVVAAAVVFVVVVVFAFDSVGAHDEPHRRLCCTKHSNRAQTRNHADTARARLRVGNMNVSS